MGDGFEVNLIGKKRSGDTIRGVVPKLTLLGQKEKGYSHVTHSRANGRLGQTYSICKDTHEGLILCMFDTTGEMDRTDWSNIIQIAKTHMKV